MNDIYRKIKPKYIKLKLIPKSWSSDSHVMFDIKMVGIFEDISLEFHNTDDFYSL